MSRHSWLSVLWLCICRYILHGGTERYGLPSFAGENHLQFDFACYLEASVSLDLFEPDFVLCVKVMVDDMMHEFIFVHKETWMVLGTVYVALGISAGYMKLGENITIMMLSIVGATNLFAILLMFYVRGLYNPNHRTNSKGAKSVSIKSFLCCGSNFLQQKFELLVSQFDWTVRGDKNLYGGLCRQWDCCKLFWCLHLTLRCPLFFGTLFLKLCDDIK